jgi:phosphoketolase
MATIGANGELSNAGDLHLLDRYWRAANYLFVGQIYLLDNPLLHRIAGYLATAPGPGVTDEH